MRRNKLSLLWNNFVKWFIALMPFYYVPFLFIADAYGPEWEALRIAKDYIILVVIVVWFFNLMRGEFRFVVSNAASSFVFLYISYGVIKILSFDNFELMVEMARIYILYPIWFFVAKSLYTSRADVQLLITRWIIVSVFVSVIAILEWLFFGGDNIYSRAAGQTRSISTLFSPNALGWYLAAMSAILVGMIRFDLNYSNDRRTFFSYSNAVLLLFINSVAIISSGSRSALFANILIISLWVLSMLKKTKVATTVVISVLFVAVANFAMPSQPGIVELRVFGGAETSRVDIYSEMLKSYWSIDFFGILFGLSPFEYSVLKQSDLLDDSYFLTVIASGGLFSIILFALMVITGFLKNFARREYHSNERTSLFYLLSICCILGLIGNLQGIFPLAIIFWVAFGLFIQMSTRKSHKLY